jgi:ubiquitin carboxyl-terminal hydrolase 25
LAEEDVEMSDQSANQKSGSGDNSSDTTLVEMDTLPPSPRAAYDDVVAKAGLQPAHDEKNSLHQHDRTESAIEDDDTQMADGDNSASEAAPSMPDKPPPVPPRNKAGLSIQTNTRETISEDDLWRFGSQQDVTEVIGNVVWRMQCAIKANSIEESTEEQIDDIRDTFFGANAVYTQKSRALERKVEPWANLIVFPPQSGSRDIYEALDVVFDEQIVDIANTVTPQYASINKLPPILQIQIQRTAFDPVRQLPWKNRNPVIFEPTIYLDRYMDSNDPTLMRRRRETWKWKAQLRGLEARQAALKATPVNASVPEALFATKGFIDELQESEIDGLDIDPALPEALEERFHEVAAELDDINNQITNLKQKLSEQFIGMESYKYDLQTVFIHRGESGGGHYWIYIYDFKSNIWREYNDEYVTEVKDTKRIFDHASQSGGTPYYLAYVRSADKNDLVDAVFRDVKEVEMEMVDPVGPLADLMDEDEGITMEDNDDDEGEVRHVEYARPRPLLPKLAAAQNAATMASWDTAVELDATGGKWD